MFCDVHSTEGLDPSVDCSVAVFPGWVGSRRWDSRRRRWGARPFLSGSGVFAVGFGWGGFGRMFLGGNWVGSGGGGRRAAAAVGIKVGTYGTVEGC